VHHLVSGVSGRLRSAVTAVEILGALFPGGTITGCPKLRAMEIITELEGGGRGAYTGSLGYVSRCGRMDFNILIRSLVVLGNVAEFRAGAGIVADSQPESELLETRHKARGLLDALSAAA
jgi:anthranilate synthase component 1